MSTRSGGTTTTSSVATRSPYTSLGRNSQLPSTTYSKSPQKPKNQVKPKKKGINGFVVGLIIVGAIVLFLFIVFIILYYFVFDSSSGTPSTSGNNNPEPQIPSGAPVTTYGGSGGVCLHDTDCPVITVTERDAQGGDKITTYTQYCVDNVCATNKPCELDSECIPDTVDPDDPNCDPLNPANPCKYTGVCLNNFCQRQRCMNNLNCGVNEACTINQLDGRDFGYCLPIGNKCNQTSTIGGQTLGNGSLNCYGGFFPCTGGQGGSEGFCTNCVKDNECNMASNFDLGPGSYCKTISPFDTGEIDARFTPSTCVVPDGLVNTFCDAGQRRVDLFDAGVCCNAGEASRCGETCSDDFQCDNDCPFCVAGKCSCMQLSVYSSDRSNITSTFSCIGGSGVSGYSMTGDIDSDNLNQIADDVHVCIAQESEAAYSYDDNAMMGTLYCTDSSRPYYIPSTGRCSSTPDDSICKIVSGRKICVGPDGNELEDYVCAINNTCQKRRLQLGEYCDQNAEQCDEGLVCQVSSANSYKRICVKA
jgi:hypothetical protein